MRLEQALRKAALVRGGNVSIELRCSSRPERVASAVSAWLAAHPDPAQRWHGRLYASTRLVNTWRMPNGTFVVDVEWLGLVTRLGPRTAFLVHALPAAFRGECVMRFRRTGRAWKRVRPLRRDGAARKRDLFAGAG